MMQVKSCGQK
jgi:hypothetical protein